MTYSYSIENAQQYDIMKYLLRRLPFKFLQKMKQKRTSSKHSVLLLFEIFALKVYRFLHTLRPILETVFPLSFSDKLLYSCIPFGINSSSII